VLEGGSGLELLPLPPSEPEPLFDPSAPFVPAAVGTAGEIVPEWENPYEAPRARVDLPVAHSLDPLAGMVLARRFTRLVAAILDSLIVLVPAVIGLMVMGDFGDLAAVDSDQDEIAMLFLRRLIVFALPILAINVYLLGKSGQTLGKKALGIRIVRTDGTMASLGRLLVLRIGLTNLLGFIPILGNFFGLLDSLFIFGEERRCVHDYFADTMVVVA